MKGKLRIAGIVGSVVAVLIGSGFGYNTYKAQTAKTICDAGSQNLKEWQNSKKASVESLVSLIADAERCSKALESIPVKSSEVSERIKAVDDAVSRMRSALPLMAMAEGLQDFGESLKAQNQPTVKPQSFETLPICQQLDSIAKSGKSVSDFIKNSSDIGQIKAEINSNCDWHSEQLQRAVEPPSSPITHTASLSPSTGQFMGYASTNEPVYYVGTQGTQVIYTIGSDRVSAELACDPGFFKNVYSNGAFVQDVMYPQSEATRQVLILGCKSTNY